MPYKNYKDKLASQRRYYDNHPEKERARAQEFRRRNPNYLKNKREQYRQENRCVRCSIPLIEEEFEYCMNCTMKLGQEIPKRERRYL